jgi:N utilization substance protein A
MEDLAEQATDELIEFEGVDEEQAAKLIMTAREPWFAEAKAEKEAEKQQAADSKASNV